jgi:hypothetical protein
MRIGAGWRQAAPGHPDRRGGAMKPTDLAEWMTERGLNKSAAAETLGCTRDMLRHMLDPDGPYRDKGLPRYIALACAAISFGLPPYR